MRLTRFGAVMLVLLALCGLGVAFASGHLRWVAASVGVFILAMLIPGGVAGGVAAHAARTRRITPSGRLGPTDRNPPGM
jgi:hypothetical protein